VHKPVFVENASALIHTYDAFFVDLWGVTHNGLEPFKEAISFFEAVHAAGKRIVFLSNAPRMPQAAMQRLVEMGIDRRLFTTMVTSGGECHTHLQKRGEPFYADLGKQVYYYGPAREKSLLDNLEGYTPVDALGKADFILMTSTLNWEDTLESVAPFLARALQHNLPIVCANADNTVMRGDAKLLCAGAIAREYIRMGGRAFIHGKPSATLYALAHSYVPDVPLGRVLMIGDSLETDIKGANAYGVDSLLLLTGVHGGDFAGLDVTGAAAEAKLNSLMQTHHAEPAYWARSFF
jgi:HAD superfamily hydrolase (TIGR01459 family)